MENLQLAERAAPALTRVAALIFSEKLLALAAGLRVVAPLVEDREVLGIDERDADGQGTGGEGEDGHDDLVLHLDGVKR
jgi:hypothetical protein